MFTLLVWYWLIFSRLDASLLVHTGYLISSWIYRLSQLSRINWIFLNISARIGLYWILALVLFLYWISILDLLISSTLAIFSLVLDHGSLVSLLLFHFYLWLSHSNHISQSDIYLRVSVVIFSVSSVCILILNFLVVLVTSSIVLYCSAPSALYPCLWLSELSVISWILYK